MKRLILSISILATLAFVACSEEDNEPNINYVVCQVCEIEYQENFGNQDYEVCVDKDTIAYINNGNTQLKAGRYFELYCQNSYNGPDPEEPEEGGSEEPGEATDNCVTCDAYEVNSVPVPESVVCKGTNGNAFIDGQDLGVNYEQYIELQEMLTNCN